MRGGGCLKEAFFSQKNVVMNLSNFVIKSIMKIEDMKALELKCL